MGLTCLEYRSTPNGMKAFTFRHLFKTQFAHVAIPFHSESRAIVLDIRLAYFGVKTVLLPDAFLNNLSVFIVLFSKSMSKTVLPLTPILSLVAVEANAKALSLVIFEHPVVIFK